MQDVYKDIDEYNIDKECKILIVFNDMIADMINNIKLNSIVTKLFIRSRKLPIFLVFITQSYFKVPKDLRLNTTHIFITKIPKKKKELEQIALNHSLISVVLLACLSSFERKRLHSKYIKKSHTKSIYKVHTNKVHTKSIAYATYPPHLYKFFSMCARFTKSNSWISCTG